MAAWRLEIPECPSEAVAELRVPGEKATDIKVVLYAVPGALIGSRSCTSSASAANASTR